MFQQYNHRALNTLIQQFTNLIDELTEVITVYPQFNVLPIRAFIQQLNIYRGQAQNILDYTDYTYSTYIYVSVLLFASIIYALIIIGVIVIIVGKSKDSKHIDNVFKICCAPLFGLVAYLAFITVMTAYFRNGVIAWQNGDNTVINYLIADCRGDFTEIRREFLLYYAAVCTGDVTPGCIFLRAVAEDIQPKTDCDQFFADLAQQFPLSEYTEILAWLIVAYVSSLLIIVAICVFIAAPHPIFDETLITKYTKNEPTRVSVHPVETAD